MGSKILWLRVQQSLLPVPSEVACKGAVVELASVCMYGLGELVLILNACFPGSCSVGGLLMADTNSPS